MWKTFARMASVVLLIQCSCAQPKKGEAYGGKTKAPKADPSVTMEWEGESDEESTIVLEVAFNINPSDCLTIDIKPDDVGKDAADKVFAATTSPNCALDPRRHPHPRNVRFMNHSGRRLDLWVSEDGSKLKLVPDAPRKLCLKCGLIVSIAERVNPN